MEIPKHIPLLFICFYFVSCANTSVVMLDESDKYAPSKSVQILETIPDKPFKAIARVETEGAVGQGIPELLEDMRKEAKEIGADAIIPTEEGKEKVEQGIIYNPWLGGYQTIGGGNKPIVRGYAIIFEESISERKANYKPAPVINGGISFNALAPALGGYGFSGWLGKNKFRTAFDYYKADIPQAMTRDGFTEGQVDNAMRISFDYFFLGDLSGPYFGSGFQYANYSSGHENTTERGSWESIDFNASFGYKLNLLKNIHLDARLALDAVLYGEEEIMIGSYRMVPDDAKVYGLIGIGVHF